MKIILNLRKYRELIMIKIIICKNQLANLNLPQTLTIMLNIQSNYNFMINLIRRPTNNQMSLTSKAKLHL
jgi:hypothetical protein